MPTQRRLAEQHRNAQHALRAQVLKQILMLWRAFDVDDVDRSWSNLEPVLLNLLKVGRMHSCALAAQYYEEVRREAGVRAPVAFAKPPESDWERAALVSLRVTGPYYTKAAIARKRPNVKADALVRVSGALTRHVLNGGRETLRRYGAAEG